jgi:hypothetical protein
VDAIFRPKQSCKRLGLLSLLFWTGMMMLFLCGTLWEGRGALGPFLLVCGGLGCFIALSVFLLLAYYRESLSFKDGRIVQTGVVRRRKMELSEVTDARWRIAPVGGSVVLRSRSQKIKAYFDNFELDRRQLLIRLLRTSLPQSVQRDWEQFCVQIALPLAKHSADAPLGTDEILVTRRRWDRFFVVLAALMLPTSILCAWLLQDPSPLAIPIPVAAVWLMIRFTTPRQGMRSRRISATPEKGYLLLLLLWTVVMLVPICLLGDNHFGLDVGLMILWFAGIVWQAHRLDRRRKAAQDALVPAAAEEWERLERIGSSPEQG